MHLFLTVTASLFSIVSICSRDAQRDDVMFPFCFWHNFWCEPNSLLSKFTYSVLMILVLGCLTSSALHATSTTASFDHTSFNIFVLGNFLYKNSTSVECCRTSAWPMNRCGAVFFWLWERCSTLCDRECSFPSVVKLKNRLLFLYHADCALCKPNAEQILHRNVTICSNIYV